MSLLNTKANLLEALNDPQNKVIALTGRWGTGKSHLWRETRALSQDESVQKALYVSLFGLSSMDQVKVKIVQSAIPNAENDPSAWERLKRSWAATSKVLESFHRSFSALNEIALLAVPSLLKNRVIVLDDIERKHEKLSVEEIMGFLDEFTQQHGARFVLILNTDQLAERTVWDTLREKVVDCELTLHTSTDEAFGIALISTPSPYAERIAKTLAICKLTNIRIIIRVIRAINRILTGYSGLSTDILDRVVPSTAFLTAIHYKGLPDGPDFDFVLNIGNLEYGLLDNTEDDVGEDAKQQASWRLQIREAGIVGCDEYEAIVVEYLRSGLLEGGEVARVIGGYIAEANVMAAKAATYQLHERIIWHHQISEAELLLEARGLIAKVHHLDPATVSGLYEVIAGLNNGHTVAEEIIDQWVKGYVPHVDPNLEYRDFFNRFLHPKVEAALAAANQEAQVKTSLYETCEWIARHSGWGKRQEAVMVNASSDDFEEAIRTLDPSCLKLFLSQLLKMRINRTTYDPHFGKATDHFVQACKRIYADPNSTRLASLLELLFKDAKLEGELK